MPTDSPSPQLFSDAAFSDAGNAVFPNPGSVITTVRPKSERELAELLRRATAQRTPVTVSAALTGLTGSAVPLESGIRLDMSGMILLEDRPGYKRVAPFLLLSESDPFKGLVAPGVSLQALNEALRKLGLWYPPHPGETRAFIGGNVATNASGPRTFAFGSTRAYTESLRLVMAEGDVMEVKRGEHFASQSNFSLRTENGKILAGKIPDYTSPKIKNAAGLFSEPGMDLIDLFIGSEGILGCFSEIGLRFLPLRRIQTRLFFLPSVDAALNLSDELRKHKADPKHYAENPQASGLGILSLEFFDEGSLRLAQRAGYSLPSFPENGAPTAVEIEWFEGDDATLKIVSSAVDRFGCVGTLDDAGAYAFRYAVPRGVADWLKQRSLPKLGTDFSVPVSAFREMFRFYQQAESEFGRNDTAVPTPVRTANWGHIGDCHLHLNFLPENADDSTKAKALYLKLVREAVRLGGTVSAEHGVGKKMLADENGVSHPYLWYMPGEPLSEIAGVKKIFDPLVLLNRGNMVPVSML